MYSHQVYNSYVGLAAKIGLSTWTKLDGFSYSYLPCYYAEVSSLHYVLWFVVKLIVYKHVNA